MQHPFPDQCITQNIRLKSCDACRLSNRKCSRNAVCERCAKKGTPCIYSRNSTRNRAFRELKRELDSTRRSSSVDDASSVRASTQPLEVKREAASSSPIARILDSIQQAEAQGASFIATQTPTLPPAFPLNHSLGLRLLESTQINELLSASTSFTTSSVSSLHTSSSFSTASPFPLEFTHQQQGKLGSDDDILARLLDETSPTSVPYSSANASDELADILKALDAGMPLFPTPTGSLATTPPHTFFSPPTMSHGLTSHHGMHPTWNFSFPSPASAVAPSVTADGLHLELSGSIGDLPVAATPPRRSSATGSRPAPY
ncbi:hypothetical protein BC830DRAFT_1171200 [Chytriomyces sp. MP71]|nr:hypothetical protein BC830DRAFT_1171200 [Chytriomyces sp. MP71]